MNMRIATIGLGVGLLLTGFVAGGTAHGAPTRVGDSHVRPRAVPTSVPAVIATIPVGRGPIGVAVSADDTVYVANYDDSTVSVINPGSQTEDDTIEVGGLPVSVAVSNDDTVYVTASQANVVSVINPGSLVEDDTISVGLTPAGLVVSNDDTVYVTDSGPDRTVSVIAPGALTRSYTVPVGIGPTGIAVTGDDTVYVANSGSGYVSIVNPGSQIEDDSVYTGGLLRGVAVSIFGSVFVASNQSNAVEVITGDDLDNPIAVEDGPIGVAVSEGGSVVYTANSGADTVSVLTGSPPTQIATVTVGDNPNGIAVSNRDGLLYVTNENPGLRGTVSIIAPYVQAALTDGMGDPVSEGASGDPVTLDFDTCGSSPCPLMDDSTVQSISFGGVPVTSWVRDAGANSYSGPVPPGSGTVEVTVLFNGGNIVSAGTFTYPATPVPTPVDPPSAPINVVGVAGDASAVISWSAPASAGSFPVSNNEVTSSPGGHSCLTAARTCQVTGLTNGTAYTFSVRALNGAGWGPWSAASASVTPTPASTPALVISGTRAQVGGRPGIRVTGTATGLDAGTVVRPWFRFPGQVSYTQGAARVIVDDRGRIGWERVAGKKIYVYVQTEDGMVRSNRITVPSA